MIGALTAVIRDEARRIWCHRWLALAVALVTFGAGAALVFSLPNVYDAWGQVYVSKQTPVSAATQGVSLVGEGYGSPYVVEKTLLNDDNLQAVIRRIDPTARAMSKPELERAAEVLKHRIVVAPDQGDGFFEVHFRDSDPRLARQVVQLLMNEFVNRNVRHNEQELQQAGKFLDDQISSYESMLADSQAKIAAFRVSHPRAALLAAEATAGPAAAVATAAAQPSAEASAELAAARAAYEAALAQAGAPSAQTPARVSAAAERVSALQAKLASLRTQYTDQYPDVVAARRQLADAIAERDAEAAATLAPATPASQAASPALEAARRRLAAAQRAAAPHVAAAPPLLAPALQSEWTELQHNDEMLRLNYQQLITRREAARMSAAVYDADGSGKYQITRQPTTPSLPVGPKRMLYLAVLAVAAATSGIGAAYLRAAIAGIFVSPRELEQAFQLPVVGTVAWEPAWSTKPRLRPIHPLTALRATLGRGVAALTLRSLQ